MKIILSEKLKSYLNSKDEINNVALTKEDIEKLVIALELTVPEYTQGTYKSKEINLCDFCECECSKRGDNVKECPVGRYGVGDNELV